MMMNAKVNISVLAAVAMTMTLAGCSTTGRLARAQAAYPTQKVDAKGLFLENCARCHGKDGRAKTLHGELVGAQDFADSDWKTDVTDDQVIHAIQTGPGLMPAFGKKLSEAEIEALAVYVKSFPAEDMLQ